jgi:hypothetical protein
VRSRAATTPPGPAIKIKSAASATVPFAAATLLSVTQLTRDRAALLYRHHGLAEPVFRTSAAQSSVSSWSSVTVIAYADLPIASCARAPLQQSDVRGIAKAERARDR